jgi:Kef-type K+ transport system membrane component KefB
MQNLTINTTKSVVAKIVYTDSQIVGALALVIFAAAAGGILLGMLAGFKLPNFKPFNGRVVEPILKKIHIPPIIAMIVMGCVARNFFGDVVKPYNSVWA